MAVSQSFEYSAAADAKSVFLCGSWADWRQIPMERRDGARWVVTTEVPPGRVLFKFVVDGEWKESPAYETDTQEGVVNNVMVVQPDRKKESAAQSPAKPVKDTSDDTQAAKEPTKSTKEPALHADSSARPTDASADQTEQPAQHPTKSAEPSAKDEKLAAKQGEEKQKASSDPCSVM